MALDYVCQRYLTSQSHGWNRGPVLARTRGMTRQRATAATVRGRNARPVRKAL